MNQFWKLFASDYVQNLVSSVTIPTTEEFVDSVKGRQFESGLSGYKQKITSFFKQVPTFQQFIARVKDPMVDFDKNSLISPIKNLVTETIPLFNEQGMEMVAA